MASSRAIRRVMAALCVVCLVAAPSAFASWQVNGNPICAAAGNQGDERIVSDGVGGAIIVWEDVRTGQSDIYAQRVDSLGAVKWTMDGVAVCTAVNKQWSPRLVSDGASGAVITWYDGRALAYHIYAQRVDSLGVPKWEADGVPICTTTAYRDAPEISPDGANGAFVVWSDYRSGNADAYGQHVNSLGAVMWDTNGVVVCGASGDQHSPWPVSDDAGGAVITWEDDRLGHSSIYAQRLDPLGAAKWDAQGVPVCITDVYKSGPRIASDGASGAIIAWEDSLSGNMNIYAQLVDSLGTVKWDAAGVPLRVAAGEQRRPQIVADGLGGAIVVWEDSLSGEWDIYGQRVDQLGALKWTANGTSVSRFAGVQQHPQVVSDGAGRAIITWEDFRSGGYDVYAQYVGPAGELLWTTGGAEVGATTGDQLHPSVVPDGTGGAIIAWEDHRAVDSDIYARRLAPDYATDLVFASASAKVQDGQVTLSWQAFVDVPASAFIIMRSNTPDAEFVPLDLPVRKDRGYFFSCTDNSVVSGKTYWYQIVLGSLPGGEVCGPIEVYVEQAPAICRVYQSHPNPADPVCTIRYELTKPGRMSLKVFDVRGSLVRILVEEWREPGVYSELWDGRRDDGSELPSGVYIYRYEVGDFAATRKMVLLMGSR